MWAADDDFFTKNYIESCVNYLEKNPQFLLAAGKAVYRRPDHSFYNGVNITLESDDSTERVIKCFETAMDNGIFYGLYRRSTLNRIDTGRHFLGNDWVILAEIAYLGKVKVIENTSITRDASHLFNDTPWKRIINLYGLPDFAVHTPWTWMALETRFFLKRTPIIQKKSERKNLANIVYKILQGRFIIKERKNASLFYYLLSLVYYPFFSWKNRTNKNL